MSLVDTFTSYIQHYGYEGLFVVIFLESLGFPLPGESLLITVACFALKENLAGIMAVSVMATFLANNLSYAMGYWQGRNFIKNFGKYIFMNEDRLNGAEEFFKKYGKITIVIARFIFALRQLNGLIMGTLKMPWPQYAFFNFLGSVIWVGCWVMIPYYFGKNVPLIFKIVLPGGIVFLVLILLYNRMKSKK